MIEPLIILIALLLSPIVGFRLGYLAGKKDDKGK